MGFWNRRAMGLGLALGLSGCGTTTRTALGEIDLQQLCGEPKRCEVRGDAAVSTLGGRRAQDLRLSAGKGPEQFLGKVAPERSAQSALKTCGSEVAASDWLQGPEVVREVKLDADGARPLRQALASHLASALGAQSALPPMQADLGSIIDLTVRRMALDRVGWVRETYWLNDAAFERRIGLCGEEERENIVYSLTTVGLSRAFQRDLTSKLARALTDTLAALQPVQSSEPGTATTAVQPAEADVAAAPADAAAQAAPKAAGAAASESASPLAGLAEQVVAACAQSLRIVAALGFDDA